MTGRGQAGIVEQRRRILSGEAWGDPHHPLVEDVTEGAQAPGDGYNVALHECAHYLDAEGLGLARPPPPARARSTDAWASDLAGEFDAMLDAVDRGEDTFLDPYAAEDEAEFFAVATEDFFDRPAGLRVAQPGLYRLLQEFYGVDPASWTPSLESAPRQPTSAPALLRPCRHDQQRAAGNEQDHDRQDGEASRP
jgi:Mlc titration factor MtfA (ptsG expression regulator)